MSSLSVPVKVMVSFALLPPGIVFPKSTFVHCFSSSCVISGLLEITSSPAVTLVEWILSSFVLREIDVLSSTTSRLRSCQHHDLRQPVTYILNGHRTLVRELFEVWLEGQVVVDRLDIGGQHLAGGGDIHMGVNVCARVSTHVAAVGAVSDGNQGGMS